jgi:hypothetical protein
MNKVLERLEIIKLSREVVEADTAGEDSSLDYEDLDYDDDYDDYEE